jgi:hypothetical protein
MLFPKIINKLRLSFIMKKNARRILGPLFLIICCPPAAMVFLNTNARLKRSFAAFWQKVLQEDLFHTLYEISCPYFFGMPTWSTLSAFASAQLIFVKPLLGKIFKEPRLLQRNIPCYKTNDVNSYVLTLVCFFLCTSVFRLFPAALLYDNLGGIWGTLCRSLPAPFTPYFYICFLTALLHDRALRDDQRCAKKYGEAWITHCQKVHYKILPFIY